MRVGDGESVYEDGDDMSTVGPAVVAVLTGTIFGTWLVVETGADTSIGLGPRCSVFCICLYPAFNKSFVLVWLFRLSK
jgi:hypothetical protein